MPNSVDVLRAKIDPVRSNQFSVTIQFPVFLGGQLATEQIKFHCQSTSLPSGTTGVVEIPFKGAVLKLAGDNTYPDWSVNVLSNKDFNIYKTIQRWREFMKSDALGTGANDLTYKSVATVEQEDGAGNVIYTCSLIGLFPTNIADISLAQGENDAAQVFDVTFAFDYILHEID